MSLVRTILALILLVILAHVALTYLGIERTANALTEGIYGLGTLLESPATILLKAIIAQRPELLNPNSFYVVALTSAAGYLILYLLLGIGRRS